MNPAFRLFLAINVQERVEVFIATAQMLESTEIFITIWAETYPPDGRVRQVAKQDGYSSDLCDH